MASKRETKKKEVARPSRAEMADLFDGIVEPPQGDVLKDLKANVESAIILNVRIAEIEEMLASHKAELNQKLTKFIPDAMRSCAMQSYTHESGMVVRLHDFLSGSLPKEDEKRKVALRWIRDNGGSALIKNKFDIELERGDEKRRKAMLASCKKLGIDLVESVDVNHNSFKAWIKERMAKGDKTPLDMLGIYAGVAAKIVAPTRATKPKAPAAVTAPTPRPSKAPAKVAVSSPPSRKPKPSAQPKRPVSAPAAKVKAPVRRRESGVTATV